MYTGLKGVQVEIRWGRRSHRREFRQAKMRLGVGENKQTKKTPHNIKELGEKTSQCTGGKQGKTIIKINWKWSEDGGYRDKTEVDKVKKTLQTAGKCEHMKI